MELLGQEIEPQGLGCWGIGGRFFAGAEPCGFPDLDEDTAIRTVHAAYDAGIRLFDTAGVYGAGRSERLLSAGLKGRTDAVVVSKLGMTFDEETRQVLDDRTDAAGLAEAIEGSLRRLGRDRIDVMLLHLNALPVAQAMPVFDVLETAREAGKLGGYGWSTDFPARVAAMADWPGFVAVELAMNVLADAPAMLGTVTERELVGLVRSPLGMGILTGKYDAHTTLPPDDIRSVNSERRDYFCDGRAAAKHLATLDAVRELLTAGGRTLAQGALCWLLARSDRNLPLPGARSPAQATENAGALAFGPLPPTVMAEIEALIQRPPEGEARAR